MCRISPGVARRFPAGAKTCFIGAVGRDALAASARAFYRREKIPARFAVKTDHATATAAILVNAAGENEIIVALGANRALAPRDVDPRLIRGAGVVVTQLESNLATAEHVLRTAREAGVTSILNPAPMRTDFDPGLLRYVDILVPNEPEFLTLLNRRRRGTLTAAKFRRLGAAALQQCCRSLGVPTVIVTLGARGCFVSQPERHAAIAGHAGLKVADTTGAGDAFVGALAAGLVKFAGDPIRAARFANAAAALSVTKPGTAPAMPRLKAITAFLARPSPEN